MRKFTIALVFVLLFATSSFASNYIELMNDNELTMYVDMSTVRSFDDHVAVWTKSMLKGKRAADYKRIFQTTVKYVLEYYAFSKNDKRFQLLASVEYDKNNNVIGNRNFRYDPDNLFAIIPDSRGDTLYNFIMKVTGNQ